MRSPLRRRVALSVLTFALLGVGASSARASHTPGGQPVDRDFVTGESVSERVCGTTCSRIGQAFDVSSGPAGENPLGTVRIDIINPAFPRSFVYDVTCLSVFGNRATIGGTVQGDPAAAEPFPQHATFAVEDGGPGGMDRAYALSAPLSSPPTTCPPFSMTPILSIGVTGELTVHDAPELPSSARQCFGGGWQRYGFESLGKCLAFVFKARVCEFLEQRLGHSPKFCPPTPPTGARSGP